MVAPVYPADLPPLILAEAFSAEDQDGVVRFDPTYGEPMVRLGSTAAGVQMTVAANMSASERDDFLDFWRDDCGRGSIACSMTDPENGETALFLFTKPPVRTSFGGDNWRISTSIMRLP